MKRQIGHQAKGDSRMNISSIGSYLLALYALKVSHLRFLLPFLRDVPIVYPSRRYLQSLFPTVSQMNMLLGKQQVLPTVICSRKKSKSSSQLARFTLAASSLPSSSASASGIGYASMTFAPSHRYTSSVYGMCALAKRVSLSSKVASRGSASGCHNHPSQRNPHDPA